AMQRLERDGLLVRRALWPAPRQNADPCARQRASGRLLGLALVALRLGGALRPAGMPERLRRPCDDRVPEALGTRAARGHRRAPGLWWQCCSGRRPGALCATGDEEAGSDTGPRPGERLAAGTVGRALGTRRAGGGRRRLVGRAVCLVLHLEIHEI